MKKTAVNIPIESIEIKTSGNPVKDIMHAYMVFKSVDCGRTKRTHARFSALWQLGNMLYQAKSRIPRGDWILWLESNLPSIPERTARKYIRESRRIAQWYVDQRNALHGK